MRSRIKSAASLIEAIKNTKALYTEVKSQYENHTQYSATLPQNSYIYSKMTNWLLGVGTGRSVQFSVAKDSLSRHYGGGSEKFNLNGHVIKFSLTDPTTENGIDEYGDKMRTYQRSLVFTCKTRAGIDELEKLFLTLRNEKMMEPERTEYMTLGKWGWEQIKVQNRDWESVFLPGELKAEMEMEFGDFFANEEFYAKANIPWHRGYLFHGPPGNGKTSLAKALASKYNLSLYMMNLSSLDGDAALASRLSDLQPRSVLLIEDIDIFDAVDREQADQGPTLAGLLNSLDGVATPHGLIVIMTSNHPDALDDALVRPGRVDRKIELGSPTPKQITDAFEYVYGQTCGTPRRYGSMAEVTEVFKKNINNIDKAREDIEEVKVAADSSRSGPVRVRSILEGTASAQGVARHSQDARGSV